MNRRTFLKQGTALSGGLVLSGCLGRLGFETQSAWRDPPLVEDRPDAVYYPAIIEGMGMYGTTTAGDLGFALMHSFPHRFWNLTGSRKTKVIVQSDDSVHLMASVWDTETETILPVDVSVEISNSDGRVSSTNLWPMISPNMGFHYGDNIALPGEGKYDVTLQVGPLQTARTSPFDGRFTEGQAATMQFTFDTAETYNLEIRRLGEKAGIRGTVDLMEMEMIPEPVVPTKSELPGRLLHEGKSGDATILVALVDGDHRFSDSDGPFLIVSPRTPYNRVMLPRMALSATLNRGGDAIAQGTLQASLDPDLGSFYGMGLDELETDDTVRITVETPPQLARHDGYETAFLDMEPIEFTVE
ncbi:iron transporter [Haloarcula sp. S1AR25-5A]|uniref:Iron transporter n=2 Tax=Halobacteriales TaxID=2235 RepID=A0A8J8TAR4_9EURY|nr:MULTISPECIES: iron transporter [Halobacteria]MDS0223427.1 iron transporter [Haloarcula terrestris]TQQ78668.1 iron transporter [Halonotius terrestris]